MKKFLTHIFWILLLNNCFTKIEKVEALIPYYYKPTIKNLEKEGLSIGKNAYQLLYFGQFREGLSLARLAVKINKNDEKLWLILSEAEMANNLYDDALISLIKAEKINPDISEIYFAKSNIYLKKSKLREAKISLNKGLEIDPKNHKAIFQLGNICLMENDYVSAINYFNEATKIKPNFWQAINNKGLASFEKNEIDLSIKFFEKAISIEENAEPLLGLASALRLKDINRSLELAKKALSKDPNYVDFNYRREQLWGEKLQVSTEKLFKNNQLKNEIRNAKSKIN